MKDHVIMTNQNWVSKMETLNSDGDYAIQLNFTYHQWILHKICDFCMDRKYVNDPNTFLDEQIPILNDFLSFWLPII